MDKIVYVAVVIVCFVLFLIVTFLYSKVENRPAFAGLAQAWVAIVLAGLTAVYIFETSKIRSISEKSFITQIQPQVFPAKILTFKPKLNEETISIKSALLLVNTGKTEAVNVNVSYHLRTENQHVEGKIGPITPFYGGEKIAHEMNILNVKLSERDLKIVEQCKKTKGKLQLSDRIIPPIFLDIDLSYSDNFGTHHDPPSRTYRYLIKRNEWLLVTDVHTSKSFMQNEQICETIAERNK